MLTERFPQGGTIGDLGRLIARTMMHRSRKESNATGKSNILYARLSIEGDGCQRKRTVMEEDRSALHVMGDRATAALPFHYLQYIQMKGRRSHLLDRNAC